MTITHFAKALGRRGGLERARRLSAEKKKEIASLGGRTRSESNATIKKIEENFRYLETIRQMTPLPKVRSSRSTRKKLPGIYG